MNRKTEELEEIIGYHFKNKHYLTQALTHSSYANEKKLGKLGSNERLEFLGDAVLELISSDYLYARFTQIPEAASLRSNSLNISAISSDTSMKQSDV